MSARANSSKVVPARTVVSTRFDLSGKCVNQAQYDSHHRHARITEESDVESEPRYSSNTNDYATSL